MNSVTSVNGVPVRLPAERWFHIVENHDELAANMMPSWKPSLILI